MGKHFENVNGNSTFMKCLVLRDPKTSVQGKCELI